VGEEQRGIIGRCRDDDDGADPGDCHNAALLPTIGGSLSVGFWSRIKSSMSAVWGWTGIKEVPPVSSLPAH
jgi:hypothetical protein